MVSLIRQTTPRISHAAIAAEIGCSRALVTKMAKLDGSLRFTASKNAPKKLVKTLYLPPYNLGATEIGKQLKLSETSVRRILKRQGVKLRGRGVVPLITPEVEKIVLRLNREGFSVRATLDYLLARGKKASDQAIRGTLRKNKVYLDHGRNRRPAVPCDPLHDPRAPRGVDFGQEGSGVGDPEAVARQAEGPPSAPVRHGERDEADVLGQHPADVHPDEAGCYGRPWIRDGAGPAEAVADEAAGPDAAERRGERGPESLAGGPEAEAGSEG